MDNEEITGVKFSEFPSATPGGSDEVVGLHSGDNARFTVANFILAIRQGLANLFVPKADVGAAGGVAELDNTGKVPSNQLPPISSDADDITYDPTSSGLSATNVQDAIDEVYGDIPTVPSISTATPQMDGTGAAGSTGQVSDAGHVHPSDTSRVPVYGLGDNLLDNWYFVGGGTGDGVFPVNQRKNTTGTGTGTNSFFIDRWISDSVWQLDSDGLSFSLREGALYGASIGQRIEANRIPDGLRTVTLSALWSDGTFWTNSATLSWSVSWQCVSGTVNSNGLAIRMNNSQWHVGIWNNTSKKIQAVKLEYGTQQTLAHLEGNNYVLNTIPSYGEELRKCLRYYWDAGLSSSELVVLPGIANAGGNSFEVQISTPVLMRKATPTLTVGIEWVRGNGSAIGGYTLNTSNASMLNGFVRGIAIDKTGGYNASIPYFVAINKFIVSVEL